MGYLTGLLPRAAEAGFGTREAMAPSGRAEGDG